MERAGFHKGFVIAGLLALWLALGASLAAGTALAEVEPMEARAYSKNFGVSMARAEDTLETQAKGLEVDLVGELEQRLDEDYAGVWFDNAAGEFVVPVIPATNRAAVKNELAAASLAGDYRAPVVEYSWEELEAAQERIDAGWNALVESGALKTGMIRTGLDSRANSVVVQLSTAASEAERAGVERLIGHVGPEVDLQDISPERLRLDPATCTVEHKVCDLPLRGGAYIGSEVNTPETAQTYCSVGFPARGNVDGKRYILTAGHCIKEPTSPTFWSWYTYDGPSTADKHAIGDVEQWHYPGNDWAKINVTGGWADVAPWPSQVAFWGHGPVEPWIGEYPWGQDFNYPIYGESSSLKGQTVCHSGAKTGGTCGTVVHTDETWEYGPNEKVHGLTTVRGKYLCIGGGDSGGSVFSSNMAVGLVSGEGMWTQCYDPEKGLPEFAYTDITEATNELNVSIATTAPSQTTVNVTQQGQCQGGRTKVSGTVTSDGNPVVYGTVVVTLWKWENNLWVVRQGHEAAVSNGAYQLEASLGAGNWRAKGSLQGTEALAASESGYQEFTVAPSPIVAEDDSASGPVAMVDCDGALHVLYRNAGGKLGHHWLPKGSESWSAELQGAEMAGDPEVVIDSAGAFNVFYRRSDGTLGQKRIAKGGGWTTTVHSATMAGDPHAIVDGDGALHVLYRDASGKLGHHWLPKGSESWSAELRSAAMAGDPKIAIDTSGVFHVFYRQTDGNIGHQWIPKGGNWSGEVRPVASMAGDPRVLVDNEGAIHLFYRQSDGNLGHQWLVKGSESWGGEVRPVSSMAGDPRVLIDQSGVFHVFYRQTDGKLGHQWIPKGGNWSGVVHSATMAGPPSVVVDGDGALHVLYRDVSGKLGHHWLPKGSQSWSAELRPASMSGDPKVLIDTSGVFHVFYRQSDGKLGHQWIPKGGNWSGVVHSAEIGARPPAAITGSAAGVEGTNATVSATVAPEGSQANYYLEYGPTTAYGSKQPVSAKSAGDASGAFELSETLAGLSPGTNYHYRVVASGGEGTVYGEDKNFTTTTSNVAAQLSGLAVSEPFDGSSSSLANFNANWSALGWASGTAKGADTASGWGPVNAYPTVNGAYRSASIADSGSGIAAAVTLGTSPGSASRYFSLWLDASGSAASRAGYELRFTYTAANTYSASLSKWQAGAKTVLVSKEGVSLPLGGSLALVDKGSALSAWIDTGSGYSQLLSAADSAFGSGHAGLEGAGSATRLKNFKVGALPGSPEGWQLRNANSSGGSDTEFVFGGPTLLPVSGDWNGDGVDTPGAYDPSSGGWILRNSNSGGSAELSFVYGGCCDLLPVVGDWNKDGTDTVGLYKPSTGEWFLRNSNTEGYGEINFTFGTGTGTVPLAGDWNNDNTDTIGTYKPSANSEWRLRNTNSTGAANITFTYGGPEMIPVVGDWNKDGTDTPGLYKTNGEWFLRNSNSYGFGEIMFTFGDGTEGKPIAGDWNKDGTDTIGVVR